MVTPNNKNCKYYKAAAFAQSGSYNDHDADPALQGGKKNKKKICQSWIDVDKRKICLCIISVRVNINCECEWPCPAAESEVKTELVQKTAPKESCESALLAAIVNCIRSPKPKPFQSLFTAQFCFPLFALWFVPPTTRWRLLKTESLKRCSESYRFQQFCRLRFP